MQNADATKRGVRRPSRSSLPMFVGGSHLFDEAEFGTGAGGWHAIAIAAMGFTLDDRDDLVFDMG